MAKKIRFPLEMEGGVEVRSLEELRENFSLARVIQYFENGKLITWLKDRYEDEIADEIIKLDKNDKELVKKISIILGGSYNDSVEATLEEELERARRVELLKKYTDNIGFVEKVNQVAFDQDELYDLLDENITEIYLCGEKFSIPLPKKGIKYIGINNPVVFIDSVECVDWKERGIELEGVRFDEKYQEVVNESRNRIEEEKKEEKKEEQKIIPTIDMEQLKKLYNQVICETNYFFGNDEHRFRSKFTKSPVISKREAKKIVDDMIEEDVKFLERVFSGPNSTMFERTKKEYLNNLTEIYNLYVEIFSNEKIDFSQLKEEFEQNYNESYRECRRLFDNIDWYNLTDYEIESMGGGGFFSATAYKIVSDSEIPQNFLSLTSRCRHIISEGYNRFKKNMFFKKIENAMNG